MDELVQYKEKDLIYIKANELVDAKYKSTVMEQNLIDIALYELSNGNFVEENGFRVDIKASHIKELMHGKVNNGSFYNKLSTASRRLTGRVFGFDNGREFHYMSVITNADYVNGVLSIIFNAKLKNSLTEITSNYTKLDLAERLSYSERFSKRIAELLIRRMYNRSGEQQVDKWKIGFDRAEFYLLIGLVNSEIPEVRNALEGSRGSTVDYERALKAAKDNRTYDSISDLKKRVIEPSVKEINENSYNHIYIDKVEYIRSGVGGKTTGIVFYVRKLNKNTEIQENGLSERVSDEFAMDFIDDLRDLLTDYPLKTKELRRIAEAASFDMDKCRKAVDILKGSKNVENAAGFLISAVKDGYEKPVKRTKKTSSKGDASQVPQYKRFEQRDYDFEELEKELFIN